MVARSPFRSPRASTPEAIRIFRQPSQRRPQTPGLSAVTSNVSLAVTYYHIGGNYFPDGLGQGVYLAGGLGLTHLDPREAGLNSETRFSLSLAFGYMIPAGKNFGFKLKRAYVTLVDSTTAIFCSGGCIIQVKGDSFTQVDVLAGVSARF